MKTYLQPDVASWESLASRPVMSTEEILPAVKKVLNEVRQNGDNALKAMTQRFDGVELNDIRQEVNSSVALDEKLKHAIKVAYNNILSFHRSQVTADQKVETMPGVTCWRKAVAIEKVGLYIPGGSAPLFSTLLMLGVPAKLAGCSDIVICTPPSINSGIHPAIEFTASLLGIDSVYKVGGAQAIAAMAYGTETIPAVYKIFGPGNQYVTAAKQLVQQEGVAIDMPAGPSEVLVIADQHANPDFVASDLLSQAEHGPDSQVILVTDEEQVASSVIQAIQTQLAQLPRAELAAKSISNSRAIVTRDLAEAMRFSNLYAPEHLIINTENAAELSEEVINAGSVFLGPWSCESLGDYASGTNHTLPTNRFALNYSGVSLDSFVKKITYQHISQDGLRAIGPIVEQMAEAEQLRGHRNAVSIRLKELS